MHIAVNTRFLLTGKIEGIGRVTYEILRRMVRNHPEVQFSFLFDRPFDKTYVFDTNVKAYSIFPPTRHPILTHLWLQFGVKPFLKKQKPDVYLSFDGFMPMGIPLPKIITIHDLAYKHYPAQNRWADLKYYQHFMPRFAHAATQIITVSDYSKKDICTSFNIHNDKVTSIYNGVSPDFVPISEEKQKVNELKYAAGCPYILYVGAIHPRKNVARLIAAFDHYKKQVTSELKLVITGRAGWLVHSVKEALKNAAFSADIIFTDYMPEKDLPQLMAGASALCYISLFEGFGLPIVEAMSCGVPVICSDRNAMAEIGGEAAFLVDPENIVEISNAIKVVHQNERERRRLITLGLQRKLDFNWERAAEAYFEVVYKSTRFI